MKRHLILFVLACGLLAIISTQADAQTNEGLAELNQLGSRCLTLYRAGKLDEALEPCQRVVAIREKSFGSDYTNLTIALSLLGFVYQAKGEYAKAEPLFQRAVAIFEKELGSEHLLVALPLINLAELYRQEGDYAKAEPLYQRALAIREKAPGAEPADVASSLNKLGLLYLDKDDYAKSEQYFQRALAIREKVQGSEHPDTAESLDGLATLYSRKADYVKAEPLYQRALAIREKAFGSEHPTVAASLNGLGGVYHMKRDFPKAALFYRRALAIQEKLFGSEHPSIAGYLNRLAWLYYSNGELAKAEPLLLRALAISEKINGGEHPFGAILLEELGELYEAEGDYAKAEPFFRRAIAMDEKIFGAERPNIALSLVGLAAALTAKGDYEHAVEAQTRAQEIDEKNIYTVLSSGSERQKQLYLDTQSSQTTMSVSLHAYSAPRNRQAARLALTTILRRKGRALDVMTDQIASLRRRATPKDVKLLDALAAAQTQLAGLQLSPDTRLSPADRRAQVSEFETEIEKLQDEIGRRSAEFRARTGSVTVDAVRAAIPRDAALAEIFAYRPYDAKAKFNERFGKSRYVVYVLKPSDDAPQFVDLGDAASIDADLKLWREALLDPNRTDVRELGRKVDERVMRPVRRLLGDTRRLFISPDGALNLIPFAALVDENNKYLVESYSLNYLTSGRDLLRLQVPSENRPGAFIFANPTYNLTGQLIVACDRKPQRGLLLDPARDEAASEPNAAKDEIEYGGIDFTQICYPPLKGTAEEATLVNSALKNATILTDKGATEAALKSLNGPRILHVATHGFFLPDLPQEAAPNAGAGSNSENPLLRSGLIMAGANQKSSGSGEDGVLTAAEAAGLNLWGTKLVVLSACETGLGDVVNGAGVYGLRRALVLAGSETQVISLWQVDDAATRDLMVDYYRRLQRGAGRAEAMRQAQLAMLRDQAQSHGKNSPTQRRTATGSGGHTHPYYWAAFISSGDWRTMNGEK